MTRAQAELVLDLSRRAEWAFPTSAGPPLRPGALDHLREQLTE